MNQENGTSQGYDPQNITYAQECAQQIYSRFGCLQDGIAEKTFIERAGPIIESYQNRAAQFQLTALGESSRIQIGVAKEREAAAIASWDEERNRALREAARVIEARKLLADANGLLDECAGYIQNPPMLDAIAKHLAYCTPPGACCWDERRGIDGSCNTCGDPRL